MLATSICFNGQRDLSVCLPYAIRTHSYLARYHRLRFSIKSMAVLSLLTTATNIHAQSFTLDTSTPFQGVAFSSIAFADVDNDKDEDVLITGYSFSNGSIARLYHNDGEGKFTLDATTSFEEVHFSSIAFADIDKDKDQDILITGYSFLNGSIAKLYRNNGKGKFKLDANTPFEGCLKVQLPSLMWTMIKIRMS